MKSSVLATCVLMAISQASFATSTRVTALGGETGMIVDDDTNIDLFPQTINRQNFVRLSGIQTGAPDYAIITGNAGDKWGLYGGTLQENDFLNIYRSLGSDAAVKLGVRVWRHSVERTNDNHEAVVSKSESKNSYVDLALDGTYGVSKGERELAGKIVLAYGPNSINAISGVGRVGTFEASQTNGVTTTTADGEGNNFALLAAAFVRQPMQMAMFSKVYGAGLFSYLSQSSSFSSGSVKAEDTSGSTITLAGNVLFFDEKKIADNTQVFYGLGGGASISNFKSKDKVTAGESKTNIFRLSGPQIRLGLESDINYGKLRFGIARGIDILNYNSQARTEAPRVGAANDTNSTKTFDFIGNGVYAFSAGYGVEYKHLKVDITLMNDIWVKGPQKLFSSAAGPLGGEASVIYTY